MTDGTLAGRRLLAVTEEELQRIVLDIHDGPVQSLFAALGQLSLVRTRLDAFPDAADACAPPLSRAVHMLETSLQDVRALLVAFQAPEFAQVGVADVLEEVAVQHEFLSGAAAALEVQGDVPEVSLVVKIALFRVLQEALSNVRRHAGEPSAAIRLWTEDGHVCLEIEDRGLGFDPPPLVGPGATEDHVHIGLRGMRERAELVGGRLKVTSRRGEGTTVRVEVPVDA